MASAPQCRVKRKSQAAKNSTGLVKKSRRYCHSEVRTPRGQGQAGRGPDQEQQAHPEKLDDPREVEEINQDPAAQGAQHHAAHAHGVELPEAPGRIVRILFKQQDVQRLAEERQAQAEAPEDRQKGPEVVRGRPCPKGRARCRPDPGG